MTNLKILAKNILLKIPLINYLFISFNYKIIKTKIKIHNFESSPMIMTKRNSVIYNPLKGKRVTGLDKYLNYEFAFSKKIIDLSSKQKIFFDVGSSYGHYSWLAGKLYKKVFCFEGDSLELFFLKKNLKKNLNVEIINKFINNEFTLNNICADLKLYPDVVKLDVEGNEINIMRNAGNLLKNKCFFLIEFHMRKILKNNNNSYEIINNFFRQFENYKYRLTFNHHHEALCLKNNGISDKNWTSKKPLLHNFAIFAEPKV